MTTRRRFIQIAAALAAPAALGGVPRIPLGRSAHHFVLFEESLLPATTFARRATAHGLTALSIREGDITNAWLNSVRPAWQQAPVSIAGLTTPSALFCFEQLALAQGRRVIFHAEHVLQPDGGIEHVVQRAGSLSLSAPTLARAGARWPQRLADSLAIPGSRRGPGRGLRPGRSLAALAPALPEGATLLTSWIIA